MSAQTARVVRVTRTYLHDAGHTPVDIVALSWEGTAYAWQAEPEAYGVGQEVAVNPPESAAANITPRIHLSGRYGTVRGS